MTNLVLIDERILFIRPGMNKDGVGARLSKVRVGGGGGGARKEKIMEFRSDLQLMNYVTTVSSFVKNGGSRREKNSFTSCLVLKKPFH